MDEEKLTPAIICGDVQAINHQHKVLFSQQVEIKTSELKRCKPRIVLCPVLFDEE